ncbi:ABC transporter cdr4 [Phlyctema vagabunda]|uniref:ABC transporter cdr4 n=1 Tax=Phlyctema vagabunda TaxID=108571 RepID=A0ABR4PX96_9HELO
MSSPWGVVPQSEAVVKDFVSGERDPDGQTSPIPARLLSSEDGSETDQDDTVTQLAKTFTHNSVKNSQGQYLNPFEGTDDPLLDPNSGSFSQRAWIKTLIGIASRDPERYPSRIAGISYKNLNVHGFGESTDYQKTFGNYPLALSNIPNMLKGEKGKTKIQILRNFDGLIKSGEMLVVLGRPGSGCSTLLKTISGETNGFFVDNSSQINYQGIPKETMHKDFRGECIYQAEVDVHFPQLTVGQTLSFAADARTPRNRPPGVTREQYATHVRDVVMAIYGLSHTLNTKVGNDFIRGVSGGERKRVSIAEAALGGAPLQCWDNSTRGLDSATALEFVRSLRLSADLTGATCVVAIYQASQSMYNVFDKVSLLYEGRQIYFGHKDAAKTFFLEMGFVCPERQTTADFLTSLTSAAERTPREGWAARVPHTAEEFEKRWLESDDHARLVKEIDAYNQEFPIHDTQQLEKFQKARQAQQAKSQRVKSPYTLSVAMQIKLCMRRGFWRIKGDMSLTVIGVFGNCVLGLIVSSVFYNLGEDTTALFSRSALLFFGILLSAFSSMLEIQTLYAARPIVEKHTKYAFYHPFAEGIAGMLCDLPQKVVTAIAFNLIFYFMTNLRRTPEAFFVFFLFSFTVVLAMSMVFRSIGAVSRTVSQAMAPSAVLMLALVTYTGFTIPVRDMRPWFRWFNYLNPVAYGFEALMINEFHNREIPCSTFVPMGPQYADISPEQRICSTTGAAAGASFVDGDVFLRVNYLYEYSHLWRNLGILWALVVAFCAFYLFCTEFITAKKSKGEVLLFPRTKIPTFKKAKNDIEGLSPDRVDQDMVTATRTETQIPVNIQRQTAIFHWESVNYDIKIKKEPRRLLDQVDGWVKPGTLTALMGVSGAGKTTLLDVLASRVTMGVVSGNTYVDGRPCDSGFQRKTGYVQQQDIHLATSTVREALNFSAILRQPHHVPMKERIAYVDEVIALLEMESYADAVVGVPGEGLNVEQRKRLTIGVEMAAKPALLLFLDEPTSGLDSQTAWSICSLLRKLANNGQAILCTIHQPSAILFQEFDRLLFLAKGGRTVYFGDIGRNSEVLTTYFSKNGSRPCGGNENPAEYMLDVIGAAPGSQTTIDWVSVWNNSPERQEVKRQLALMKSELSQKPISHDDPDALKEYAAPFTAQLPVVLTRVFEQYWRTPSYLYSKVILVTAASLFIGFSFYDTPVSLQGSQNQLFSIFMLFTIFGNLVQQIMPHFVTQRSLYEARERPSKTYSWQVFITSNIIVELPWNTLCSVIIFVCFYYPIGMQRNAQAAGQTVERGGLFFLFIWEFLIFTSTFTNMVIAGIETADGGSNLANTIFGLCLVFCGVLASPDALPGFWIWMYRISPFTYLVDGILSTGLANTLVTCSNIELLNFEPPNGSTCGQYMADYITSAGGYLQDTEATSGCQFCTVRDTNTLLARMSLSYGARWRNFGIMWAFICFNAAAAIFFYWWVRVPRPEAQKEAVTPPSTASEDLKEVKQEKSNAST